MNILHLYMHEDFPPTNGECFFSVCIVKLWTVIDSKKGKRCANIIQYPESEDSKNPSLFLHQYTFAMLKPRVHT